jgi:hypothetical protein
MAKGKQKMIDRHEIDPLFVQTRLMVDAMFNGNSRLTGIDASTDVIVGLERHSLGSVGMNPKVDRLNISIGINEASEMIDCFEIVDEDRATFYGYVAASMFAGYVFTANVVGRTSTNLESSNVFHNTLIDSSQLARALNDSVPEDIHLSGIAAQLLESMERSEITAQDIAAINMHRLGARIVLEAEKSKFTEHPIGSLQQEMRETFSMSLKNEVQQDLLVLTAGGATTEYRKQQIRRAVIERLITQRGLGLVFPAKEQELLLLGAQLQDAEADDEAARLLGSALESDDPWHFTIELSDGHRDGYDAEELPCILNENEL